MTEYANQLLEDPTVNSTSATSIHPLTLQKCPVACLHVVTFS